MDYRELLLKYIEHIGDEEGVTYLSGPCKDLFTPEEWQELQALDAEVMLKCNPYDGTEIEDNPWQAGLMHPYGCLTLYI